MLLIMLPLFFFNIAFVAVQMLCLAFMPFAALICAHAARRKSLPAARYALLGAISAACLIMPWIHLIRRMRGKPISLGTADAGYIILYICWSLFILGSFLTVFYVSSPKPWWELGVNLYVPMPSGWTAWNVNFYVPMLVSAAIWAAALRMLISHGKFSSTEAWDNAMLKPFRPAHYYDYALLIPYAGASVTVVILTYVWPQYLLMLLEALRLI